MPVYIKKILKENEID